MLSAFQRELNERDTLLQNVEIEFRWGDGHYDRLPALAEDLVRRNVAIIVDQWRGAFGAGGEAGDLQNSDRVQRWRRPCPIWPGYKPEPAWRKYHRRNQSVRLAGTKQLGLLRDLVPKTDPIAMLVNPDDTWAKTQIANTEAAALAVGQQLVVLRANTEARHQRRFRRSGRKAGGCTACRNQPVLRHAGRLLIELSARHALPAVYFRREIADVGGLMSYGSSTAELYGQMGTYAGKILAEPTLPICR